MGIRFGPAGLGSTKTALATLEQYAKKGLRACELAFVHNVYIKQESDAHAIGAKARELDISLSIHAPYYVNLSAEEKVKRDATKQRILDCCKVAHWLGGATVVFHPGYYGKDKEKSYQLVKEGINEMLAQVKKRKWNALLAPETMGKVNVFGSLDEIARLVKDTGCAFCIDFAHLLARDKSVDYERVKKLFPGQKWHVHFSGIVYGDKGEKHHKPTETEEWKQLLRNLPIEKDITIINESPVCIDDSVAGLRLAKGLL